MEDSTSSKIDRKLSWQYEAQIGYWTTWQDYYLSYEKAFNTLYDSIKNNNESVNQLSFPILFLIRHCLEIGYKANIKYFSKYSMKTDYVSSKTHNLLDLYNGFKLHVYGTIKALKNDYGIIVRHEAKQQFKLYCKDIEKLNVTFEKLDKGSTSFRYPIGKDEKKVFESDQTINIIDIKSLFEKSTILLKYTADVFSNYTDYVDYILDEMEEMMKENYQY